MWRNKILIRRIDKSNEKYIDSYRYRRTTTRYYKRYRRLDEKHEIGILHGVHSVTEIDEPCQLIAELANATLVLSPNITLQDIKRSGTLRTIYVDVPKDKSREEIIQYMKDYYSDIVPLILKE